MSTVNYLWNPINDNIIAEFDDNGNTIAEYTTEPGYHGQVLSEHRNGETHYLHGDGIGNVVALTDDTENVTATYAYNSSGEVTERTGNTANPFQYQGQHGYYRDEVTGEYMARQRPLSAPEGRWLSPDPLGIGVDFNPYIYVRNSPINYRDPTGLFPVDAWMELLTKVEVSCPATLDGCAYGTIDASRLIPYDPTLKFNWNKAIGVGIAIGFEPDFAGCAKCCDRIDFIQIYHERLVDPPGLPKMYRFVVDSNQANAPWYAGTVIFCDPSKNRGEPGQIGRRFPSPIPQHYRCPPYCVAMFDRPRESDDDICDDVPGVGTTPGASASAVYHNYFEACLVCEERNQIFPLGCVSYGYTRTATNGTFSKGTNLPPCRIFGPAKPFGPTCLGGPSFAFWLAIFGGRLKG